MNTSVLPTYFEYGNPQGLPLVLIHGGAGGVWVWDEVVPFLKDFHCLMPELPEHGSNHANGRFSVPLAAQGILQLIRERTPQGRAHVFGLSVGGQVAVEMLARAPEAVFSAVISGAQLLPVPGYRLGIFSEAAMSLVYWLGIAPWKHNDAWIRWNLHTSTGIPERYFPQFKRNFQNLNRTGWAHVMSENYRYRAPAGLEKADLPVLLIAGPHEKTDIQPTNRLLKQRLPRSRAVLVGQGLGWSAPQEHNWPFNNPQLCADMLRAWITGQPLPSGLVDFS
ncbi:predicted hydrolase [Longilinea arvoryzae]|uniref:Predicted hydrolase n=1 Tax=Longilinea arvoryzae TaxID=360412 RepID=A0A0S7BF95_9CHLR|nr:alpha/beta hydrolase [Longilinea arvoryzae]GAP12433.1 predicted hydrolase [Longilinea arvoryzae]